VAQVIQAVTAVIPASSTQLLGAGGFGAIIGWFIYYVNRYRKAEIQFSDITTVVGIIGGAAILSLFKAETDLFGAYGIGLFIGFFGYFVSLVVLVAMSRNFDADFFLDGRRRVLDGGYYIPGPGEPGGGQHPQFTDRQTVVVIPPNAIRIDSARDEAADADEQLLAKDVTAICKAEWPAAKAECNQFVRAVANRCGVSLSGNADEIMAQIGTGNWVSHGTDGVAASNAAKAGRLVIGGLNSQELGDKHGHVVVVVPPAGPLGQAKYPYAYWGSLNEAIRDNGGKGMTVNYSFAPDYRDKVHYASLTI
jgi:hypothetical protein